MENGVPRCFKCIYRKEQRWRSSLRLDSKSCTRSILRHKPTQTLSKHCFRFARPSVCDFIFLRELMEWFLCVGGYSVPPMMRGNLCAMRRMKRRKFTRKQPRSYRRKSFGHWNTFAISNCKSTSTYATHFAREGSLQRPDWVVY